MQLHDHPTLVQFPIRVLVYRRGARAEEREVQARLGGARRDYAARPPAFVPGRRVPTQPGTGMEAKPRSTDRSRMLP
jgi:hypothetical protein